MGEMENSEFIKLYEAVTDAVFVDILRANRVSTIHGLQYIAQCGCLPGGQLAFGYQFEKIQIGVSRFGRKPMLDPEISPLMIQAFELSAKGIPDHLIPEMTGLEKFLTTDGKKVPATRLNRLFTNRIYIGEFTFGGEIYTNIYPAIITKELFDVVQDRRRKSHSLAIR